MIVYKDRTFCPYSNICRTGQRGCDRTLSEADIDEAAKLGAAISYYAEFPECYKAWFEEADDGR